MNAASLSLSPSSLHGGCETCKSRESRKGKTRAAGVAPCCGEAACPPSLSSVSPRGLGQNPVPAGNWWGQRCPAQGHSWVCPSLQPQLWLCPTNPLPQLVLLCPHWPPVQLQHPLPLQQPEEPTAVSSKKLLQSLVGPGLSSKERRTWGVWRSFSFLTRTFWVKTFKTLLTSWPHRSRAAAPSPARALPGPQQPASSLLLLRAPVVLTASSESFVQALQRHSGMHGARAALGLAAGKETAPWLRSQGGHSSSLLQRPPSLCQPSRHAVG